MSEHGTGKGGSPGSLALVYAPLMTTLVNFCDKGWGKVSRQLRQRIRKTGSSNMTGQLTQLPEFSSDEVMCCYNTEDQGRSKFL